MTTLVPGRPGFWFFTLRGAAAASAPPLLVAVWLAIKLVMLPTQGGDNAMLVPLGYGAMIAAAAAAAAIVFATVVGLALLGRWVWKRKA